MAYGKSKSLDFLKDYKETYTDTHSKSFTLEDLKKYIDKRYPLEKESEDIDWFKTPEYYNKIIGKPVNPRKPNPTKSKEIVNKLSDKAKKGI